MRIGIVVGEASGDILGAGLIKSIKSRHPDCQFEGIGGPLMQAQGFRSLFPLDRLSVMGLVEPLKRLPELLGIRKQLRRHFLADPPALVLGIDSPDFNLDLELKLRRAGLLTAHYVSPSVWAWRQKRVKKIKQAVDLVLTLFPFETAFYHQHNVRAEFVGHPLADQFDFEVDTQAARQTLGFADEDKVIALLPGSRAGEVKLMGALFLETAQWCLQRHPGLRFVVPAANEARKQQLQMILQDHSTTDAENVSLLDGNSQLAMSAADVVLMASGTTTLEAMLLKKGRLLSLFLP